MEFSHIQGLDEEFVLHTYSRFKVAFTHGENATLYDTQNRDYIDFGSGIGVVSVGHNNPKLTQAITKQAAKLLHTSNLYYIQNQAALAHNLITLYRDNAPLPMRAFFANSGAEANECNLITLYRDNAPLPMRAFFANSGAEANECAIKIARKYGKQRNAYKIITLDSSFHGRTITSLKATAQEKMHEHFGPFPDGFVYAKDVSDIYNLIDSSTCAVLLELVQGEGGVCPLDKTQIQALASHLKQKQILLMIDEVQSGIYRCGEIFASKVYGISPEVITTAKGLGGGVPIGAVLTTLTGIFAPSDHGSTFGGNALSCAAGLCVLEILSQMHENGTLKETISYFDTKLDSLVAAFPQIFSHKVGLGLMCGIYTQNPNLLPNIVESALNQGVLVLKSGKGVLRLLPPLSINKDEIDLGFSRLESALKTL
ncbi:aspartate aminotransferase family protein [Helicobacter cinaedi]|uniref:aspartate aminotransferase family protein n=1 Tax=Helicobacter cinaedi TaxID=213 RepID=UPI000CF0D1AC|nr:aspartate aminotransferase family protein [Helicobacter cinaedi]AWK62479.1 aspartate aminotransferase family protein [Helicobacter cinaedi]QOQ96886.1 aspartate aminotransferase family protein [Helicobacter cinaedi]